MKRTLAQNKRLHALITKRGIGDETKAEMVFNLTKGRTDSTAELTYYECNTLIRNLENVSANNNAQRRFLEQIKQKQRRTVFAIMYQIGFIDNTMTMDFRKFVIEQWIINHTRFEGTLNDLNSAQLGSLINQLRAVNRNYDEKTYEQAILN